MLSKYWHTQHRNEMLIIGFLIASKFKPGNSSLRQRLLKWMTQVQGSSDQHVNAGPGELSTYIYIILYEGNMRTCLRALAAGLIPIMSELPGFPRTRFEKFQWFFNDILRQKSQISMTIMNVSKRKNTGPHITHGLLTHLMTTIGCF